MGLKFNNLLPHTSIQVVFLSLCTGNDSGSTFPYFVSCFVTSVISILYRKETVVKINFISRVFDTFLQNHTYILLIFHQNINRLLSSLLHPPLHFIHAFIGVAVYLVDGFAWVFLTVSCTICRVHF